VRLTGCGRVVIFLAGRMIAIIPGIDRVLSRSNEVHVEWWLKARAHESEETKAESGRGAGKSAAGAVHSGSATAPASLAGESICRLLANSNSADECPRINGKA
jgi:hypothetical protein